jgi:hypothetical protein
MATLAVALDHLRIAAKRRHQSRAMARPSGVRSSMKGCDVGDIAAGEGVADHGHRRHAPERYGRARAALVEDLLDRDQRLRISDLAGMGGSPWLVR